MSVARILDISEAVARAGRGDGRVVIAFKEPEARGGAVESAIAQEDGTGNIYVKYVGGRASTLPVVWWPNVDAARTWASKRYHGMPPSNLAYIPAEEMRERFPHLDYRAFASPTSEAVSMGGRRPDVAAMDDNGQVLVLVHGASISYLEFMSPREVDNSPAACIMTVLFPAGGAQDAYSRLDSGRLDVVGNLRRAVHFVDPATLDKIYFKDGAHVIHEAVRKGAREAQTRVTITDEELDAGPEAGEVFVDKDGHEYYYVDGLMRGDYVLYFVDATTGTLVCCGEDPSEPSDGMVMVGPWNAAELLHEDAGHLTRVGERIQPLSPAFQDLVDSGAEWEDEDDGD